MFFAARLLRVASLCFAGLTLGGSVADAAPLDDVPAAFMVAGRQTIVILHGVGPQIYVCKANADGALTWSFREPVATLLDGDKTVGRHYAGPNWDLADGSGITGKVAASHAGATGADIPWLALQVVAHRGEGALNKAALVVRLHTVGGLLEGACPQAGDMKAVPYAADYLFFS
ncbi:DUF3455 domain-containing protein [Lichenihabitans sp. Uapishka_5]|uniref:DUF3455 domain-containing protein n=1 Tax=Lichenihabitans sp. Uapishka_5 TaxID=3037302 RepID=UPI0029E821E4|nr:DUF3455 domain-containing protein [Lichenihabitans sp. Uapishka_5]MDX7953147.1 DUF3455 domain-containing protein [Lichenihabitans sp. Uapishka_5]